MARQGADKPIDYSEVLSEMEQAAEAQSPGVLLLVEAYEQSLPVAAAWRPLNASAVAYATGTSAPHGQ